MVLDTHDGMHRTAVVEGSRLHKGLHGECLHVLDFCELLPFRPCPVALEVCHDIDEGSLPYDKVHGTCTLKDPDAGCGLYGHRIYIVLGIVQLVKARELKLEFIADHIAGVNDGQKLRGIAVSFGKKLRGLVIIGKPVFAEKVRGRPERDLDILAFRLGEADHKAGCEGSHTFICLDKDLLVELACCDEDLVVEVMRIVI